MRTTYARCRRICVIGACLFALLPEIYPAAPDAQIVVRRGGSIDGTVDGSVLLSGKGGLSLGKRARLAGEIVVPRSLKASASPDATKPVSSPDASGTREASTTTIVPTLDTTDGFNLPSVIAPSNPIAGKTATIDDSAAPSDIASVGNLTVNRRGTEISLPPGSYGAVTVARGAITLGYRDRTDVAYYTFRSFDVQNGGEVRVVGPVVVTTASAGTWKGNVGNPDTPLWLEVRIAGGDVVLEGSCAVSGFILAPSSRVTLYQGATVLGGLAADEIFVRAGATLTAVNPDWLLSADRRSRPLFAHKALRLERQTARFRGEFKSEYSPGIAYINDTPYLMLAQHRRPEEHPRAAKRDEWAFFRAACTLFVDTGFEQGYVVLTSAGLTQSSSKSQVRNVKLLRKDFEAELARLGGASSIEENIRACATNGESLVKFVRHWLGEPSEPPNG